MTPSPIRLSAICRIVLLSLLACPLPSRAQPPGESTAVELSSTTACVIREGTSNSSYQLLGTVAPSRITTIGYALDGRVKTLHVDRGQRLSAGDAIADLQTDVIQIEIAAAKAQLRLVQQQLAELEAGSRKEDIAEAKARMEAAAAISRRNASQLKRMTKLVASKAASVDELDVATSEADSSRQLLRAATIGYERMVAGPRVEQVAQAKASVELQQQQVRLLEDRLNKHRVVAPFDGYVTTKSTEAGAWITSGDPVVDLIDLDTVQVEVAVPADQTVALRLGQSIRVECDQHPEQLLIGQLERIIPAADTRSRTFPILVAIENRIENERPVLMSGMVVRIDLPIGPEKEQLFVPTDSIVLDGAKQYVFIVDESSEGDASVKIATSQTPVRRVPARRVSVRRVPVRLGVADGSWISVQGDLEAGALVITRGNERLVSGQTVEVTVSDG